MLPLSIGLFLFCETMAENNMTPKAIRQVIKQVFFCCVLVWFEVLLKSYFGVVFATAAVAQTS